MNWVVFTDPATNQKISVNVSLATVIRPHQDGCLIAFDAGNSVKVAERYANVAAAFSTNKK